MCTGRCKCHPGIRFAPCALLGLASRTSATIWGHALGFGVFIGVVRCRVSSVNQMLPYVKAATRPVKAYGYIELGASR